MPAKLQYWRSTNTPECSSTLTRAITARLSALAYRIQSLRRDLDYDDEWSVGLQPLPKVDLETQIDEVFKGSGDRYDWNSEVKRCWPSRIRRSGTTPGATVAPSDPRPSGPR